MRECLVVALGWSVGAMARYGSDGSLLPSSPRFPTATLLVNTVACFTLGVFLGLSELKGWFAASSRLVFITGFLGSSSTYSTFAGESDALLRTLQWWLAALNIGAHGVLGLVALWLGFVVAELLAVTPWSCPRKNTCYGIGERD